MDRREFLQSSAAGSAAAAVLAGVPVAKAAASERVRVGVMGGGGRALSLNRTFASNENVEIVAIVDIDPNRLAPALKDVEQRQGKAPRAERDFRRMIDDKSIDALVVGTPDHWHAIPTILACQAGKDVYVEKPDGHNIVEGQRMIAALKKHKRVVQMGSQHRSTERIKSALAYIKTGVLGRCLVAKAWESSKQGPIGFPADEPNPPAGVDYEMWMGPAPKRPFNRNRFHGRWRWFFDYGTGDLGNDGVHRIDYVRAMLGVEDMPETVSCAGGKFFFEDDQQWPDTQFVTFEFPGKVIQYEMRLWSRPKLHDATEGAVIYGENGWMMVTHTWWKAWDAKGKLLKEGRGDTGQTAHARNFLDAIKSRRRESLNQEIYSGHVASSMCHMGNIAWRTGKKLRFDSKTETFDDAEANKLVGREHREGFELPGVD